MQNQNLLALTHTRASVKTLGQWMSVGDNQYYIANYQRKYEWGETEVEVLIQDILERRIQGVRNLDGLDGILNDPRRRHNIRHLFLSQIMLQRMGEEENPIRYSVVDGQQRLVTIVIVYAVLQFYFHEIQYESIEDRDRSRAEEAANAIRNRMLDARNNDSIIIRQLSNARDPQQPSRADGVYQPIRPECFTFNPDHYTHARDNNNNQRNRRREPFEENAHLALILLEASDYKDSRLKNCSPAIKNAVKVKSILRECIAAAAARNMNVPRLDFLLEFQFALENMVYWTTTETDSLDVAMTSFRGLNSRYTHRPLLTKDVLKVLVSRVPHVENMDIDTVMRASMDKIAVWSEVEREVEVFCNEDIEKKKDSRVWSGRLGASVNPGKRPDSIMNRLCQIVATWKLNKYLERNEQVEFHDFKEYCKKIKKEELESLFLVDFRADHNDFDNFEEHMKSAWEVVRDGIWRRQWLGLIQPRTQSDFKKMNDESKRLFEWLECIQNSHWQPLLVHFLKDVKEKLEAQRDVDQQGQNKKASKKRKKINPPAADGPHVQLYSVVKKLALLVFCTEAGKAFSAGQGAFVEMYNHRLDNIDNYAISGDGVMIWWATLLNLYVQNAENARSANDLLNDFDRLLSGTLEGTQNDFFSQQVQSIGIFAHLQQGIHVYRHAAFENQSIKQVLLQRLAVCPLDHSAPFTKAALYAIYNQRIDGEDMSVEHLLPQSKIIKKNTNEVDRANAWYKCFQDRDGITRLRLLNMLGNFHLLTNDQNIRLSDGSPREKSEIMGRRKFHSGDYNQHLHDETIVFLEKLHEVGVNDQMEDYQKTEKTVEYYKERHRAMLEGFSKKFEIHNDDEFNRLWTQDGGWESQWLNRITNN